MRHLMRGAAPTCLANYQHGRDNWNNLTANDRASIWIELEAMQGEKCAYCEGAIQTNNRHIEHFRQKHRDPTVTFLWSNLFGSCNRVNSCGKHKDRSLPYDDAKLIKPDTDNPEHFFVFASDGSISPRKSLSAVDQHKATETIRIFNLDDELKWIRRSVVAGYVQTAEYFAEIASEFTEDEWMPLLNQELTSISTLPFATAIKHVLTRQC